MSLFIFGSALVLSQFYILKSGLPQPAHFLLIMPLLIFLFQRRRIVLNPTGRKAPVLLLAFFFYSSFVNFFYAVSLGSTQFLFPVLYFLYGLFIYFTLQNILIFQRNAFQVFSGFLLLGLGSLFLLAFLGLGGFKFFPRYNAFFNDPNQMAFWALCVSSMLLAQRKVNDTIKSLAFMFLFYILMKSASRSGLVGFSILVVGFSVSYFSSTIRNLSPKRIGVILISTLFVAGLGYYFVKDSIEAITFLESRVDQVDVGSQAEIRGYTRFLDYPEYVLLGAGQGEEHRFSEKSTEMHSTWAGLLFYYGIPGFLMILAFIYSVASKLSFSQKLIFAAPLLYSFSTLGFRTPIFWIFLSFFYCLTLFEGRQTAAHFAAGSKHNT